MPAYTGFNLATQGRNGQPNITTDYYSGLNRPSGTANLLSGNNAATTPNLAQPRTPAQAGQGWQQGQDAIPYLNQYLNGRNPYGETGFSLENALARAQTGQGIDPRLYNYGYTRTEGSEGGATHQFTNQELDPRGLINRNGQQYAQVGESINRIIDPTKVEYDPRYGLITTPDNINLPDGGNTWKGALAMAAIGGAAFSGMGAAGAAGGGAEAGGVYGGMEGTGGGLFADWTAPSLAETAGGVGTASQVGTPGAAGELAANGGTTWSSASGLPPPPSGVGPVSGTMGYEGAAGAAGAAGAGGSGSGLPFGLTGRDLATGASGLFNLWNSRNTTNAANNAANRADTWGEDGRKFAKEKLLALMNDPSSIENTPGYQFARSQGEQGINRAAAGKGYFRSPNMLFDLSKFNQGLAEKTWNSEWDKYAKMAGLDFNPSAAANIQMNGNQQSTNMRAAGVSQLGSSFFDWLGRNA